MLDFSKINAVRSTVKINASEVLVAREGGMTKKTPEERALAAAAKLAKAKEDYSNTLAAAMLNIVDAKLTEEDTDTLNLTTGSLVEASIKVLGLAGHGRARARSVARAVIEELFGRPQQGIGVEVSRERLVAILTPVAAPRKAAKGASR